MIGPRIVYTLWIDSDGERAAHALPVPRFLEEASLSGPIGRPAIVFLSGRRHIPSDYAGRLGDLGCEIIDAGSLTAELDGDLPDLGSFSNFERRCFLRWLVLERLFGGDPVWHLDADMFVDAGLAETSSRLQGLTFILQGCPGFAVIHDREWYERYRMALGDFLDDPARYSTRARRENSGWETTKITRWAGERIRESIASDQDLISHLVHTARIPQSEPRDVLLRIPEFAVFENPLECHLFADKIPIEVEQRGSRIDFNGRRVLLWHLQSGFAEYLNLFAIRERTLPFLRATRLASPYATRTAQLGLLRAVSRRGERLGARSLSRLELFDRFWTDGGLRKVLSDQVWWRPGVFQRLR